MKMLLHGLLFSPLLGASEAGRKCLAASHLLQHKVSSCGFRTLQQFKLIQEILSFAQKQPIAFCGFCFFFFSLFQFLQNRAEKRTALRTDGVNQQIPTKQQQYFFKSNPILPLFARPYLPMDGLNFMQKQRTEKGPQGLLFQLLAAKLNKENRFVL